MRLTAHHSHLVLLLMLLDIDALNHFIFYWLLLYHTFIIELNIREQSTRKVTAKTLQISIA